MRTLLKERDSYYSQADSELKADVKSAPALADEVVQLARENAGW
jgi:hypothetical protein